ncbi:MAG TPA: hydroxysqualene dehydroxylase HpnE [Rhodospirillales bacterium]|nr:hydroxysqualene dehydroxylase HpnE [Rhodospirillales bacterium]
MHVVGGGLAGLAAAVEFVAAGRPVSLYDQAGHAGGRCRSFFDDTLQRTIDNGNHLVLSGNTALAAYLRRIGAEDRLSGPARAAFSFVDLATGERWTVRPGAGRIPWWILSPRRRIPGSRLREYLAAWRLARAAAGQTVTDCVDVNGALYRRFWEPLAVSVLNTAAEDGAARLLWPVLRETFGRGEAACRPRIATRGLADSFVEPALAFLHRNGAVVRLHARLRAIGGEGGRVRRLHFTGGSGTEVAVGDDETVVLAVPPAAATALLPELRAPEASRAIVNAHFRVSRAVAAPDFLGLVGATAQWIFLRDDIASVTVSAADGLAQESNEAIAGRLWPEVRQALQLPDAALPPWRIVKEKRATFAQTPAEVARRPGCRTRLANLLLAGDWTDTGLPATIEGSVRSGHTAAACLFAIATKA